LVGQLLNLVSIRQIALRKLRPVVWTFLIIFIMELGLALAIVAISATICVTLYRQVCLSLEDIQYSPEEHTFTPASARPAAQEGEIFTKPVYPIDAFPGSRQVKTVYGTIHVFEWGPEDGEKVLLIHGLGTPCIALGDMAKELVRKGHRVMIYGELYLCVLWETTRRLKSDCD
jgi:hypothetical protein